MEAQNSTYDFQHFLAGAIGGTLQTVVGYPFDTTKVQLQTQDGQSRYKGTLDAIRSIRHHGWARGFYRGLLYPLMTYGGINSIIFGVYGNLIQVLAHDRRPNLGEVLFAGSCAGAAQVFVTCPVEGIKCVLQAQIPHDGIKPPAGGVYYQGSTQCFQAIWRTKGFKGLYHGFSATLLRDIPSYGIYMTSFEIISSFLKSRSWADSNGFIAEVVGGGLAGTMGWLAIMPADMIKSRIQSDLTGRYRNTWECAVQAAREEGLRAFYRGTVITCFRAFPSNAATFLAYVETMKYLNSQNKVET